MGPVGLKTPRLRINLSKPAFSGTIHLSIRDVSFKATKRTVLRSDLARLGINPDFLVAGLKIFYLDAANHARFCDLGGFHYSIEGFFPLAKTETIESVFRGEKNKLPDHTRIIVLPKGENKERTLAHEIFHDILIGGSIPPAVRGGFIKTVFTAFFRTITDPKRRAEKEFFKEVAQQGAVAFDLNMTVGELEQIIRGEIDYKAIVFVGECFAYAAELYLGYTQESSSYKLPREIRSFFDKYIPLKI